MELLAPAGSFAAFEAALDAGADAVYVGAPGFNARALARDFSYGEIEAMIARAHKQHVRLYVAMNSLVREDELARAVEGLACCEAMQADALIVQDMGLARLARRHFPGLRLHVSTLMSAHNSLAAGELVRMGFRRVVLARELTIGEIGAIFRATGAELEVFVHGAMCFSFSGLCLFSSLHGGKSSLRGHCVQPCRRRYVWQKKKGRTGEGGYLFSMNDLCGADLLPALREAGVVSLKIEGRMKSAAYVRNTVRAYRLLLDRLAGGGEPDSVLQEEVRRLLDAAMGRKRSTGFFLDRAPSEAVSPHFSGNIGIPVGRVRQMERGPRSGERARSILSVHLRGEIGIGDRLRLHDERSGERSAFTLRSLRLGNRSVQRARPGQQVSITVDQALFPGRPGSFRGDLFKVDDGSHRREEQAAERRLSAPGGRGPHVDRRRIDQIVRELEAAPSGGTGRGGAVGRGRGPECRWWVCVRSWQDMRVRLPFTPDNYILPLTRENMARLAEMPGKSRRGATPVIWSLPPFLPEDDIPWYASSIATLAALNFSAFQLGHWTQRRLFEAHAAGSGSFSLYGDFTFNILNTMSVQCMSELGFSGVQFSIETDRENLARALGALRGGGRGHGMNCPIGLYVYGRPALFTARLDDRRYAYGRRFVSPKGETYILERSSGITTARPVVPFSLLEWRKELADMGIDYLVVDVSEGNIRKNEAELVSLFSRRRAEFPVMTGNFPGLLL